MVGGEAGVATVAPPLSPLNPQAHDRGVVASGPHGVSIEGSTSWICMTKTRSITRLTAKSRRGATTKGSAWVRRETTAKGLFDATSTLEMHPAWTSDASCYVQFELPHHEVGVGVSRYCRVVVCGAMVM